MESVDIKIIERLWRVKDSRYPEARVGEEIRILKRLWRVKGSRHSRDFGE